MATWPTGWREELLRVSRIPKTQFALDVLLAWQRSTPTEPWTNNPLGLPKSRLATGKVVGTEFGTFATWYNFRSAFKAMLNTKRGIGALHALANAEKLSDAWREIHSLDLPGNKTETDYPVRLLDMIEEDYRSKVTKSDKGQVKTVGVTQASPDVHHAMRQQALAMTQAAQSFGHGRKAIEHVIRRLG